MTFVPYFKCGFKRSAYWNVASLYASQFIQMVALSLYSIPIFAFTALLFAFCIFQSFFLSSGGVFSDSYGAHILALVSPFLLCYVIPAALRMRSVGRVALCGCCICYFANLLQIFTYDLLFERAALLRGTGAVFYYARGVGYGCGLKAGHIKCYWIVCPCLLFWVRGQKCGFMRSRISIKAARMVS